MLPAVSVAGRVSVVGRVEVAVRGHRRRLSNKLVKKKESYIYKKTYQRSIGAPCLLPPSALNRASMPIQLTEWH